MSFDTLKNYSELTNDSSKKKIGILIGGKTDYYTAGSYIRVLSPLNELSYDFTIKIIDDNTFNQFLNDLNNNIKTLDTLIIQRDIFDLHQPNLKSIELLFKNLRNNNIKIIFDIDDDLLHINKTHPGYEKYNNLYESLKFIVKKSDLITVSTEHLKKKIIGYNKNVIIIPNTLMKHWNFNLNRTSKNLKTQKIITIGYFGTRSHERDFNLIINSINNVRKYFPHKNINIEIIGISNKNYEGVKTINIPNNYKKNPTVKDKIKNIIQYFLNKFNLMPNVLPHCDFINWMKNEINWDIAIAPLEYNNINQSKSNLKYLEYTALNIPGIYSNIGSYKEIAKKNTGIVVDNNTEDWKNAIIKLIENNELYETLLINAHNDVKKNYLVENAAIIWKEILK